MKRIYVDLDDVLAQTGRMFLRVLAEEFGREVAFDDISSYHLGDSFDLDADGLADFMQLAHEPEALLSIEPMPGARATLEDWLRRGYDILVVTGRPPATRETTLEWLARQKMPHSEFHFLDKYSDYYRGAHGTPEGAWGLSDLDGLELCLAVEDFPGMTEHLAVSLGVPVALFDRPWNRRLATPANPGRIVRCRDWSDIARRFPEP